MITNWNAPLWRILRVAGGVAMCMLAVSMFVLCDYIAQWIW